MSAGTWMLCATPIGLLLARYAAKAFAMLPELGAPSCGAANGAAADMKVCMSAACLGLGVG